MIRFLNIIVCAAFLSGCASAFQPEENRLFQQNRFVELEQLMEGRIKDQSKAKTDQLLWLCHAYGKLRRYDRLFPCVDFMQANIERGDNKLYWFDFTASPALLRTQAAIELGDLAKAREEAATAERLTRSKETYKQMRILALEASGLTAALSKDKALARRWMDELKKVDTSYPDTLLSADKYFGMARIALALGEADAALYWLAQEEDNAAFRGFADVLTGASLAGESLFTYVELPKQFMRAHALFLLGRMSEAKGILDSLLRMPQAESSGDIYWIMLLDRGLIADSEKDSGSAYGFYSRAIDRIEAQRATIRSEAGRIGFAGDKNALYGHAVAALLAQGKAEEAFITAERAKARALVDLLAGKKRFASAEQKPDVAILLTQLEQTDGASGLGVPIAPGNAATRSLARSQMAQDLAAQAPRLAPLVTIQAPQAIDIRSRLAAGETLLEYFATDDSLIVFVVTRDGVSARKLDARGLDGEVKDLRAALANPNNAAWQDASSALYARLIAPIEDRLGSGRLTVVPHGPLHYVPFAALGRGGRLLIDRGALRLLPSASVLTVIDSAPRKGDRSLLAFGNPDLGKPEADLPGAEDEVRKISRLWNGAQMYLRKDANETRLRRDGASFAYLHFASHGVFSADRPLDSAIYLSPDAENDGKVTVSDLYDLTLNADLVTLSACETGVGDVRSGDDVVGLMRGLLYAGARAIVASLWPVADAQTTDLMVAFYRHLLKNAPAESLRQAQQELRTKYPHPFYWAAFQLNGAG